MNFEKTVQALMGAYAIKHGIGNGWSQRYKRFYPHILSVKYKNDKMDINDQSRIIYAQNILTAAKGQILIPDGKWHSQAHHLNSSQVMCYNLFRPMMDEKGYISEKGCNFINNTLGISLFAPEAVGSFEYVDCTSDWKIDAKGKASNFDFHIKSGETEIFFEVKYKEKDFGKVKHKNQEKYDFYKRKVKSVLGFDVTTEELKKYYQLFRISIRISENNYVVFLYPAANTEIAARYKEFTDFLMEKGIKMPNHVKVLLLEDCSSYVDNEFKEKYLCYLKRTMNVNIKRGL